MALSFFRALNPTSKSSGCYRYTDNQSVESNDFTVDELITSCFNDDHDFLTGLIATFDIIYGAHYLNEGNGTKGALDFLILPLIARKLITDTYLTERKETYLTNFIAWVVAIPIELARFSAAVALTLLLIPVVAIVHAVKACRSEIVDDLESRYQASLRL